MFALASIGVGVKAQADQSHVAIVALARPHGQGHWKELQEALRQFDRSFAERLLSRTTALIPVIRANARVLSTAVASVTESQRLGDQYGTLLAGAWSLTSCATLTPEEARAYVSSLDLTGHGQDSLDPDEWQCLQHILSYQIRLEGGLPAMTVGELGQVVLHGGGEGRVTAHAAKEVLKRHGIRVEPFAKQVQIANTHRELESMLRNTPWQVGWHRFLTRLKGATTTGVINFGGGVRARATALPLSYLDTSEEEVYSQDDAMPF